MGEREQMKGDENNVEMISDINENKPHEVSEVICLKCLNRWISVYSEDTLLKEIDCPKCGEVGYVIKTGQTIPQENECDTCKHFKGKCLLGLSENHDIYCGYRESISK